MPTAQTPVQPPMERGRPRRAPAPGSHARASSGVRAIKTALLAVGLMAALAVPAQAADGTWNRAIGFGVNPNSNNGEVCTIAAACAAGANGALGGEFNFPEGVATDSAGNIYVADTNNERVQKFDSSGKFMLAFGKNVNLVAGAPNFDICTQVGNCMPGTAGAQPGAFDLPSGVAADAAGNVYVAAVGIDNRVSGRPLARDRDRLRRLDRALRQRVVPGRDDDRVTAAVIVVLADRRAQRADGADGGRAVPRTGRWVGGGRDFVGGGWAVAADAASVKSAATSPAVVRAMCGMVERLPSTHRSITFDGLALVRQPLPGMLSARCLTLPLPEHAIPR